MYFADGTIMAQIPFKNGVITGEAIANNENGKKLYTMRFVDNKPNGTRTAYYPNGKIRYTKKYKNGVWTGKDYKEYAENGNLRFEISDDGFATSYLKNDGMNNMVKMSAEEKQNLMKRIDNREEEKKEADSISSLKPQPRKFF